MGSWHNFYTENISHLKEGGFALFNFITDKIFMVIIEIGPSVVEFGQSFL